MGHLTQLQLPPQLSDHGSMDIKMWAGRSQSPKSPKSPKKKTKAKGPGALVKISQEQGPGRTCHHPLSSLIILYLILFGFIRRRCQDARGTASTPSI